MIKKRGQNEGGAGRLKYGALMTALSCLAGVVVSWGNHWILTGILGAGVLICGMFAFLDIRKNTDLRGNKE